MKIISVSSFNTISPSASKNVNFNGRTIMGTYYEDKVIKLAKKAIKGNTKITVDDLKKSVSRLFEESKTSDVVSKIVSAPYLVGVRMFDKMEYLRSLDESRKSLGIATLGISEILNVPEVAIRKIIDNRRATKMLQTINNCSVDILKERAIKVKK